MCFLLDMPSCVTFKLRLIVFKNLHGLALRYLSELCIPVVNMEGRRQRRFATRWQLLVYIPPVHLEVTADLRLLTLARLSGIHFRSSTA